MTITLQPDQERAIEEAIRAGAFQSVDEFVDPAIATRELRSPGRSSRWMSLSIRQSPLGSCARVRRSANSPSWNWLTRGACEHLHPERFCGLRGELDRRRRARLHQSLQNPHPESADLAELAT